MKKLVCSLLLAIASVAFVPSAAHAIVDIDVSVGIAKPAPSGDFTYNGATAGTKADLKDTLNMGTGSDTIARLNIDHALPLLPNLYIHHLPIKVEGESELTQTLKFGDTSYTATTAIKSVLELGQDDIGLYYHIPFVRTATADIIDLKLGLNARLLSLKASVESTVASEEKSLSLAIPMAYVGLDIKPIELVSIVADLKALSVGGNSMTEFAAEVRIKPVHILYLGVGYAYESITIDSESVKASVKFSEPYFFVGAEF